LHEGYVILIGNCFCALFTFGVQSESFCQ